jgi:tripartite ATP-independent transporter DctM subunit
MGASVGDFYEGALIPGLALAGLYAVWVTIVSIVKPAAAPGCPPEARTLYGAKLVAKVFTSMIPPLVLIFLVLGTIFLGIATPTEGGAMGASGAIIMALAKRKLSFALLKQAIESTATMTSFVMFILVGSTVFSLVFRGMDGDLWVEHLLTSVPGGALGFLIVVNVMIFLLAFFLDYFEIAFIMVPLLAPVAQKLGIDLVWFGVLLAVNMQTSFLHPPFGFALFYLRSVAPKSVRTSEIYWGAIPFVVIQVLMIGVVIAFPRIVTGNISEAAGALKGSGAEELRRQIESDTKAPAPGLEKGKAAPKAEDTGAELERLLKGQ